MLLMLAQPQLFPWVRFDIEGVERIPRHGPAVLVANHRSYIDPIAIGFLLARRRSSRPLPRQEGGLRRADRRRRGVRARWDPGRPGDAAPTSRCEQPQDALARR